MKICSVLWTWGIYDSCQAGVERAQAIFAEQMPKLFEGIHELRMILAWERDEMRETQTCFWAWRLRCETWWPAEQVSQTVDCLFVLSCQSNYLFFCILTRQRVCGPAGCPSSQASAICIFTCFHHFVVLMPVLVRFLSQQQVTVV